MLSMGLINCHFFKLFAKLSYFLLQYIYIMLFILTGLLTGIFSGLVGLGGGAILIPILIYGFGYSQHLVQVIMEKRRQYIKMFLTHFK